MWGLACLLVLAVTWFLVVLMNGWIVDNTPEEWQWESWSENIESMVAVEQSPSRVNIPPETPDPCPAT